MPTDQNPPRSKSLEHLFESIVARAHETIVVTDGRVEAEDGPTILFVNDAAAKRTGYPGAALVGAPLRRIVLPEAWLGVIAQLRQIRERGVADQSELRAKDHAGKEYWIELSTLPIYDEGGALEYLVRVGRDVTPRKIAERQREMTQDLMASLFGAIDVPLIVVNESGNVIMTNVALQSALGWSLIDATDRPATHFLAEEDRPGLTALLASGEMHSQRMPATLLKRSGASTRGAVQVTKVKSPNRHTYHLIKIEGVGESASSPGEALRARTDRPVIAGKLQLVGFDTLKDELGGRWPELHDRVFAIADQVIRKHLDARDICQRSGDGFLVFFEHLEEADAQAKAAMIGEEVRRRLMGELPEGTELRIAAYAARVSVPAGGHETDQGLLDAFNRRLEDERQRREAIATQAARHLLETAKPVFQRVETIERQPAPLVLTRLPSDLKELIATLSALGQPTYSIEADAFGLAGAGAYVIGHLGQGPMPLVLVPLRFGNLSSPRDLEKILRTMRSIGDAGRAQVAVEITEVPHTIIPSRLADMAMRFSALVRSVVFELPTAERNFAVGLPMSTRLATISAGVMRDPDGALTPSAQRLVRLLQLRQCRLLVKDADLATDLPALKEAGVSLVASAA